MDKSTYSIAQQVNVGFDYPVLFTEDVFNPENRALLDTLKRKDEDRKHRAIVFIDSNVAKTNPELSHRISSYFAEYASEISIVKSPEVITGGEEIKNNYRNIMQIVDLLLEYKLCRQSYVIAIGGGAVQDAVGFAAALVHRGLRLLRMPTTVLSQNDAGIGVKNGMNLHGSKNSIGTFAPPFAVINDILFLDSLDQREWIAGISEAFKVAIIKDKTFFEQLCADAKAMAERDSKAMQQQIIRCAELHLEHIATSGDAFELGTARPLDFGHWAAHRLESMSQFAISHGHAVATGIAIDSIYAARKGFINQAECDQIIQGLRDCGFSLWYPIMEQTFGDGRLKVLQGLDDFQEHLGGELTITFPDGIGRKQELHEIDHDLMSECILSLEKRAGV